MTCLCELGPEGRLVPPFRCGRSLPGLFRRDLRVRFRAGVGGEEKGVVFRGGERGRGGACRIWGARRRRRPGRVLRLSPFLFSVPVAAIARELAAVLESIQTGSEAASCQHLVPFFFRRRSGTACARWSRPDGTVPHHLPGAHARSALVRNTGQGVLLA